MMGRGLILLLLCVAFVATPLSAEQWETQECDYLLDSESTTFDRGVNRNPYIYKGELLMGVTAAHGNISASNSQLLLLVNTITAEGSYTSVNPYIGYTLADNRVLGVRFGFDRLRGSLDSGVIDLGEANDLSFDVPYVGYSYDNFNYGIFFRSYAGLDPKGRVALFADLDLTYTTSRSTFEMEMGGDPLFVRGEGWKLGLNFNPGVEVYVLPNISASLIFGLGGISYQSDVQYDREGFSVGESTDSKLSLKFNILAINIGINIHLWGDE